MRVRSFIWVGALTIAPLLFPALVESGVKTEASSRYRLEYRITLSPQGEEGKKLEVWVPYPTEDANQKILKVEVASPLSWQLRREKRFGNKLIYLKGRWDGSPLEVTLLYEVERKETIGTPKDLVLLDDTLNPNRYRGPDRLVPIDRQIREMAEELTRGLETPQEKIRALYDYVVQTMTYSKEGSGWGQGDAIWACNNKRGNCTDFHSLFIALARSEGIPARFIIGLPIPEEPSGTVPGYHCWAEFYDEQKGWIPVDASEGKKMGRPDDYFGHLPTNRIQFTVGRDLILDPPQRGDPLNYFIYPYVEVNGKPLAGVTKEFRFERLGN